MMVYMIGLMILDTYPSHSPMSIATWAVWKHGRPCSVHIASIVFMMKNGVH